MTLEQEQDIVKYFKAGNSYKLISATMGLPIGTISSFLSRKHKNLKTLVTLTRTRDLAKYSKIFVEKYGYKPEQAEALFLNMRERFDNKKMNAIRTGETFSIQFSDVEFQTHCPMLGIPLNYAETNWRAPDYPTFDRIDNTKGYVAGNVQIVSWRANRIKSDASADELIRIGEYLRSFFANRNDMQ